MSFHPKSRTMKIFEQHIFYFTHIWSLMQSDFGIICYHFQVLFFNWLVSHHFVIQALIQSMTLLLKVFLTPGVWKRHPEMYVKTTVNKTAFKISITDYLYSYGRELVKNISFFSEQLLGNYPSCWCNLSWVIFSSWLQAGIHPDHFPAIPNAIKIT